MDQVLDLVGSLDDTPGTDTPRERFRRFLAENLKEVGQLRDSMEECLREPGDQHSRALQDLVNHLGTLLGFRVTFGRYKGTPGQNGFDGLWQSSTGLNVVVEVKTTDAYAIKTSTLVGYVDGLISDRVIPSWDSALGLYIVGRADAALSQLKNAISAENRVNQLRVVSIDRLLALAELLADYEASHQAVLAVLKPVEPVIDPLIELMSGLVAGQIRSSIHPVAAGLSDAGSEPAGAAVFEPGNPETAYWLTPVASEEDSSAEQVIKSLLGAGIYALGERTPGRKALKQGDWICFYASGIGVIAHARVKSPPNRRRTNRLVRHPDRFPYVFELDQVSVYSDRPTTLSPDIRSRLDAFKDRDQSKPWAWFVQGTGRLSKHDYFLLTQQGQ
ncbi:MAG: EVE domain-containing protein [Bacillota bacterium]